MELYVHIPFCVKKCRYCDFASFAGEAEQMDAYVSCLLKEAEAQRGQVTEPLDTVYLGGGTPSLLSPAALGRLLKGLRERLPIRPGAEWTSEANPGTLTAAWLDAARSGGVNRLSLGMQAAQPAILSVLGRIHRQEETEQSVRAARQAGFRNLNLDLMFGIPGQTRADWAETLEAALALGPEHLSAYGLIPEDGTPLTEDLRAGRLTLPEPEEEREMYGMLRDRLAAAGLFPYEVSNFARPGYACRHNIGYWRQVPCLGLGLSAASMLQLRRDAEGLRYLRVTNPRTLRAYRRLVEEGAEEERERVPVSPAEARFETLMLGLRMYEGVSEADFLALHGVSLAACYGAKLRRLRDGGLMNRAGDRWFLTERGMDIQNAVLVELMDD